MRAKADYITWEMEHGPLDFNELREFMRGLVEGGPTRTGHQTPAVIVTLPISGRARCGPRQCLDDPADPGGRACTAFCSATPKARKRRRLMIEAARYPAAPQVRRPVARHPRQWQPGLLRLRSGA